jgi:nucleoside-diphosphate-sugar epimerase
MIGKDINEFKSIPLKEGLDRLTLRFIRNSLQNIIQPISNVNDKIEEKHPFIAKWVCKAPRKLLKIPLKKIVKSLPEMDSLDMTYYAYDGFINISKAKRLLNYTPKYSVNEGMVQTEKWLKDQCFI